MKGLILSVVKHIPIYLVEMQKCVVGPKAFLRVRRDSNDSVEASMWFLGISVALATLIVILFTGASADVWSRVGAAAVTTLLSVLVYSVLLLISWRLVGAKAAWDGFLVTYAYASSVFMLGFTVVRAAALGALALEPAALASLGSAGDPATSWVTVLAGAILAVGVVTGVVWWTLCWGSYRDLTRATRRQSVAAFILFSLLSVPGTGLVFLVGRAVSSGT